MSTATGSPAVPRRGRFGGFANRRIKTKIFSGFAVVLVLSSVTAAVVWSSFRDVETGFRRYETVSTNVLRAQTITQDTVTLRRNMLAYIQNGSDGIWVETKVLRETLLQTIQAAIDNSPTPERREQMGKVKELLGQYAGSLDRAVALRAQREKGIAEMTDLASQIGQETAKIIETATASGDTAGALGISGAQGEFLTARIAVWRYLVTLDDKDAAAAQSGAVDAAAHLREAAAKLSSPESKRVATSVADRLPAYAAGVKDLATTVQAINALVNVENGRQIKQASDILAAATKAQQESLVHVKDLASTTIDRGSQLSVGAAALGVVVGLLLA